MKYIRLERKQFKYKTKKDLEERLVGIVRKKVKNNDKTTSMFVYDKGRDVMVEFRGQDEEGLLKSILVWNRHDVIKQKHKSN